MSRIVVIHHDQDFDGLFCREIARQEFGGEADYIGWDYGDAVPKVPDDTDLYLLDISIDALMSHPRLTWIDHHKSAIEKYGDRPGLQVDGVAACRLAWQFWFSGKIAPNELKEDYVDRNVSEPLAVRLAGEFDVWDKRDDRADPFQLGLKAQNLTPKRWEALLTPGLMSESQGMEIVGQGRLIERYKSAFDADVLSACGFDVQWEGLNFLALNTARCNSLTFQSAVRPEHDGLLGFRYDGQKWTVSLYGVPHRPDVDLSVIAMKYGGGGHKQACGFQASQLPFLT